MKGCLTVTLSHCHVTQRAVTLSHCHTVTLSTLSHCHTVNTAFPSAEDDPFSLCQGDGEQSHFTLSVHGCETN